MFSPLKASSHSCNVCSVGDVIVIPSFPLPGYAISQVIFTNFIIAPHKCLYNCTGIPPLSTASIFSATSAILLPVEWVLHKNSTSVRAVSLPVSGTCRTAGTCTKVSFRIKKCRNICCGIFYPLRGSFAHGLRSVFGSRRPWHVPTAAYLWGKACPSSYKENQPSRLRIRRVRTTSDTAARMTSATGWA